MDLLTSSRETVTRALKNRGGDKSVNSLVIWTVIISLLVALNVAIWTFCLFVFGYPERAFNYRILTRLGKLEPPTAYTAYSSPKGTFQSPQKVYAKYYEIKKSHLTTVNAVAKRQYVRNFKSAAKLDYVRGTFEVYYTRKLTPEDVFPSGQVVRAFDPDLPQAIVELVLPTKPDAKGGFTVGDPLSIDTSGNSLFATVLHIERMPDYQLCFTLVPLVHGKVRLPGEEGGVLQLSAPETLNLDRRWPITRKTLLKVPVPVEEFVSEEELSEEKPADSGEPSDSKDKD